MDTILASIRRILNEDEVAPVEIVQDKPDRREPAPAAAATPVGPDKAGPHKDDVLVLGKAMMVPPERVEPAPPTTPQPAPVASSPPVQPPPAPIVPNPVLVEGLIAARTRAATTQSFEALHEAMLREQAPPPGPTPAMSSPHLLRSGGPTLEDLVRDELRGLISNWLDEHLPGLVEALVRSEIEKLTRRPG